MVASRLTPVLLVAALAAACGSDSMDPNRSTPTPSTALLSVTPQGGATNVDRAGPLVLRFDGAMMPGMEAFVDLHRGDVTGPTHPIGCEWSEDHATLTCMPEAPLEPHARYMLHLGGGMRDADGAPVQLDPGHCNGQWVGAEGPMAPGMGHGGMPDGSHGGEPWTGMGSGWRHQNGSYGMGVTFETR